jgi:HPt (histidine-containing phosphotransfer) domain-containing protein
VACSRRQRPVNHWHVWVAAPSVKAAPRMSLQIEWIPWMPSPPLVPEDRPLDIAHLERATFGDRVLEREVLGLFVAQSVTLMERLRKDPSARGMLAHTLKGAARGIGAFTVADAAEDLEDALARAIEPSGHLQALDEAVNRVRDAITSRLGED